MNHRIETVCIIPNLEKERVIKHAPQVVEFLERKGITPMLAAGSAKMLKLERLARPLSTLKREADLILVLGGDGTFLHATGLFHGAEIPMVGINFGAVGFLNEILYKNYKKPLMRILAGEYSTQKRMMMKAEISGTGRVYHCLNDFIFIRHTLDPMLRIRCSVNNKGVGEFRSDGLIIATPTGSTAYSLSANGPVLTPLIDAVIINPICAHELAIRPLVVDAGEVINLDFAGSPKPPYMAVDGRKGFSLACGQKVRIMRSEYSVNLVITDKYDYYDVLSKKLGWIT
jgi:NAD+ kinase